MQSPEGQSEQRCGLIHQWWQPRRFPWASGNINNKPQDAENEDRWDEDRTGLALTTADCAPARLADVSSLSHGVFQDLDALRCSAPCLALGEVRRVADFEFRGELRYL